MFTRNKMATVYISLLVTVVDLRAVLRHADSAGVLHPSYGNPHAGCHLLRAAVHFYAQSRATATGSRARPLHVS